MTKLDRIEIIDRYKIFQIREIIENPRVNEDGNPVLDDNGNPIIDSGGYHRRVLSCDMTLEDDEHQEVKDKAKELWTDDVKANYQAFLAKQNAKLNHE